MSDLNVYTTAEINALTPITGDLVVDSDTKQIKLYNGSAWKAFTTDSLGIENQYSVQYDGVNDYATLGSTISFSGEFTISTWLNLGSLSGTQVFFGEVSSYIYIMYSGSNSRITFVPQLGQSGINASVTWNTSEWHHFMVTRNSSNDITLYVDGSSVTTSSNSNTLQFRSFGQSGYYYTGYIDEYAVWDSDQSANIGDIRDSSSGTPKNLGAMSTNPTHWWRMGDNDSGSGTTITDVGSATTKVDASLVGSVISSTTAA